MLRLRQCICENIGTMALLFLLLSVSKVFASDYKLSGQVITIDTKAPARNVRIIFAPETENGEYCVFRAGLFGDTDKSGKFSINGLKKGKYFVFFSNESTALNSLKNEKIPTSTNKLSIAHLIQSDNKLKDPVKALEGGQMAVKDGELVIHGFLFIQSLNLLVFSKEGQLQYIDINKNISDLVFEIKPGVVK